MAYQIFISYRRYGGEALAYLINSKLSSSGYSVFYDIESLSSGKFNTKILEIMDTCNDVIVILPPNALDRCVNEDDWLRLEITYALKKGKNLVPVMMNGFSWPDNMPEEIQDLKNYNGVFVAFDFFDGVISRILQKLVTNVNAVSQIEHNNSVKHMLLWGDFDIAILEKIVKKLQLPSEYYIDILGDAVELLSKNLGEIETIILIITDCTKLSNNPYALQRINETLVEYVRQGGRLICTHDVIYRRTRNEALQEMFGCKIVEFHQAEAVTYIKNKDNDRLSIFDSLPDQFTLHDAEICWGDVAPDVDVHFSAEDGIPLVFSREYGKGVCIYMNSGEFKETLPRSILKPEKEFIQLLQCAIKFSY